MIVVKFVSMIVRNALPKPVERGHDSLALAKFLADALEYQHIASTAMPIVKMMPAIRAESTRLRKR